MTEFTPGDVVVLKSGSMRMLVERIEGDSVAVVWANDGGIGRDTLPVFALNKWEDRPRDDRPARGGHRGDSPPRGDRKPYGDKKPFGDKKGGDRPPRTGMDGKPRQKTHFRKDD